MDKFEIQELRIENFRGIKKLEIKDIGDNNFIFGKNGTSKSTILQALRLLLDRGYKNSYSFEMEDFNNENSSGKIILEIKVFYPANTTTRNPWIDFIEQKYFRMIIESEGTNPMEPQLSESFNGNNWVKTHKRDWDWLKGINLIWISPNYDSEKSKENLLKEFKRINKERLSNDIDSFQGELKNIIDVSLTNGTYNSLEELKREIENEEYILSEEFETEMGLMDLKFNLNKQVTVNFKVDNNNVNHIGDGLSRINAINMDIKSGKLKNDSDIFIILFEEVENNLHISKQRKLLKELGEGVLKDKSINFITTHSPNMIFFNKGSTFIRLFNDKTKVLKLDEKSEIVKSPHSPFINIRIAEALFYENVYIIEGNTEAEFYDLMFNNNESFYEQIMNKDIYFLVANGAHGYVINDFLTNLSIKSICKIDNDINPKNIPFRKNMIVNILKEKNGTADDSIIDKLRFLEENNVIMSKLTTSFEGELISLFNDIHIEYDSNKLSIGKVKYLREIFENNENISKLKEIDISKYEGEEENKIFRFLNLFNE